MLQKLLDRYCRALSILIGAALALMVALVFTNVVLRYAFNSGITVSEELSRWLFVWVTFLGATIAMHEGTHLGTDMLVSRLTQRGKSVCLAAGHVLMLFICWLLFKGSLDQVRVNIDSTSAAMEVSMAIFYSSGMVCAASGGLILCNDMWRLVTGQLSDEELVGIRESEEDQVDLPKPLS